MNYIDKFLNSITMYRLVFQSLVILAILGIVLSATGQLPFHIYYMVLTLGILLLVCIATNTLLGKIFHVPINLESAYITSLILFLIFSPATSTADALGISLAGVIAMTSKYVLGIKGKHFFNPAAIAALLVSVGGLASASWWIGSLVMLPAVAIVALLIVKKIRRFDLFLTFLVIGIASISITGILAGNPFLQTLKEAFTSWPLVFLGGVMLTEPLTTPPTRKLRMIYGALTGALLGTPFHIGPLFNSPETSLILANIFSYIVSPKQKLILTLKEKIQLAPQVFEFIFKTNHAFAFTAGQYLEWTLGHDKPDPRGVRRYFTIASAPTETEVHLGVKIPEKPSTFKQKLNAMKPGEELLAGQLSGDFTLPEKNSEGYVAIAGGIGITPFRSQIKKAIDKKENLNMVLFYASANTEEFVYKDIFKQAESVGLKTIYVLSGAKEIPPDWQGKSGYITKEMIEADVPNYKNRTYYLSGPNVMVDAYKKLLASVGIPRTKIVTDYFPGY